MKQFRLVVLSYIKRHLSMLIAATLTVFIFAAVFYLYNLPVEAVLYAAGLSLFLIIVIGSVRFYYYYRYYKTLDRLKADCCITSLELPPPKSVIDEEYQTLISLLDAQRMEIMFQKDKSLSEMTDYYTLWAHQIKTPIAAMRLLLQTETTGQNAELAEQLFRIEQYVDMVLGYLRTESMSSDLVIKPCCLDGIIKQAVRKYAKSFIRKKIALEYNGTDTVVLTDEKWLVFVLEQLLSNSLKYTNEGKITIYIDPALPVTLVIEDTGIGIRPEDLPRIGEKGFTGYNGHEDKKSTGIGMYLCKKILKKLSCALFVESQIGVGTKVKIRFNGEKMIHE